MFYDFFSLLFFFILALRCADGLATMPVQSISKHEPLRNSRKNDKVVDTLVVYVHADTGKPNANRFRELFFRIFSKTYVLLRKTYALETLMIFPPLNTFVHRQGIFSELRVFSAARRQTWPRCGLHRRRAGNFSNS